MLQAVQQGIWDRWTSHTESSSAIKAESVARYDHKYDDKYDYDDDDNLDVLLTMTF